MTDWLTADTPALVAALATYFALLFAAAWAYTAWLLRKSRRREETLLALLDETARSRDHALDLSDVLTDYVDRSLAVNEEWARLHARRETASAQRFTDAMDAAVFDADR